MVVSTGETTLKDEPGNSASLNLDKTTNLGQSKNIIIEAPRGY